jgi:hypothetical protein
VFQVVEINTSSFRHPSPIFAQGIPTMVRPSQFWSCSSHLVLSVSSYAVYKSEHSYQISITL